MSRADPSDSASEAPIGARRSGNADGAKGCRFERTGQGDMGRHRAGETMTTRLTRLTQKVRELRGERLSSLMGMLFDPEGLRSSFERQEERKAPGVDGVRKDCLQPLSPTFVENSNWEPDGVTHHVRFCEGPGVTVGWLR